MKSLNQTWPFFSAEMAVFLENVPAHNGVVAHAKVREGTSGIRS
ncbi:hypothetical protein ACKC9G_05990 [Pokkaliibacter sp. CJK22405]